MRRPFVAGNWKMNMTLAQGRELVSGIRQNLPADCPADVAVCPSFVILMPMAEAVAGSPIMLGAQNVYFEERGAFTGEVSCEMLLDAHVTHVIIGHSERRHVIGETGDLLAKKVRAAQQAGLNVIYCLGETLDERKTGRTEEVVGGQFDEALGPDINTTKLTLAYEPVWAIGTGVTATTEQAQEVHAFLRQKLESVYNHSVANSIRIQYGGSVKPGNAAELMSQPDVDGALVGGAGLKAHDFCKIIEAAAACQSARA